MDKLMSIKEFVATRYTEGSAPKLRTIRSRLERGELPGEKDGKLWMVNITKLEQGASPEADEVDSIVDAICSDHSTRRLRAVS